MSLAGGILGQHHLTGAHGPGFGIAGRLFHPGVDVDDGLPMLALARSFAISGVAASTSDTAKTLPWT